MFTRKKVTNTKYVSFSLDYWQHQGIILRQTNARTIQSLNLISLLKLATRVKGLMFTHNIHIKFQHIVRRSTERAEKLCHMIVSVRIRSKRDTCLCSFLCPCHAVSMSMFVSGSVFNNVHTYVWKTVRKVRLSKIKSIYVWKVFSISSK